MYKARAKRASGPRSIPCKAKAYLALVLLLLLLVALPRRTRSQTPVASGAPAANAIPQRVVYQQLFQHVVFLDNQADVADQHGQNGNQLRNYYQIHAGLTPLEGALLKSTSHDAVTALHAINQQIHDAVIRFRAQFPAGSLAHNKTLPKPSAELIALQNAKDQIILDHLAALKSALPTDHFQRLDTFVQSFIAPHITLTTAMPQVSHRADGGKHLAPLQPVGW